MFITDDKHRAVQATDGEAGKTPAPVALAARVRKAEQDVRAKLALLQARYDNNAFSPAVFSIVRSLEIELARIAHQGRSGGDE